MNHLQYYTPATLASMAADLRQAGYGLYATPAEQQEIRPLFLDVHFVLCAHVGENKAAELIDAAERSNHAMEPSE